MPESGRRRTWMRAWREHRGLTLEAAAEAVGVTHATLSRVERGKLPYNQDLLEAMADLVGCTPADLLTRDPAEPESIWSVWEHANSAERRQIVEIAKALLRA